MSESQSESNKPLPRASLRLVIGILYGLLALGNIIVASSMIVENQMDLVFTNIKLQSQAIAQKVVDELAGLTISREADENYKLLEQSLRSYEVSEFIVFGADGKVWRRYPEAPGPDTVERGLIQRTVELTAQESLFRSRYEVDLNQKDYSIELLMPLKSEGAAAAFLFSRLSVAQVQERIFQIYIQIAWAVAVGIVLHLIFALFVYRLIFRRVETLKEASLKMAGGELQTRVEWKRRRQDELDDLGDAFNSMAGNIQQNVDTITLLNDQIQEELQIGKEVQELFLGKMKKIKEYKPALFYRPLREVSGDCYKFYNFRGGYTGVFFADASGHGVSAALITTITILSLEEVLKRNMNPSKVCTHLNALLADRLDTTYYATGVFCLFDKEGRTYVTNAGHNNVIVFSEREDEEIQIKSHGPPLGLMDGVKYKANMINTRKGDRVFIHSDGLPETTDAEGNQFTIERVLEILKTNKREDNETIARILREEFVARSKKYHDDVTFLLLEIP